MKPHTSIHCLEKRKFQCWKQVCKEKVLNNKRRFFFCLAFFFFFTKKTSLLPKDSFSCHSFMSFSSVVNSSVLVQTQNLNYAQSISLSLCLHSLSFSVPPLSLFLLSPPFFTLVIIYFERECYISN